MGKCEFCKKELPENELYITESEQVICAGCIEFGEVVEDKVITLLMRPPQEYPTVE